MDRQMELRVTTDLALFPQMIEFNYGELRQWLSEKLSSYAGMVVTESDIKAAKTDRAALNRLMKAFEEGRKSVKAQCMAPYEEFEAKVKELTGMISDAHAGIDKQVKAIEDMRKQEKYAAIEGHYNAVIGALAGLVPLERVIHAKWANATMTINEVFSHIDGNLDRVERDLETIKAGGEKYEQQLTDIYLSKLDLGAALAEKSRLIKQDRLLAEREARLQEEGRPAVHPAPQQSATAQAHSNMAEQEPVPPPLDPAPASDQMDEGTLQQIDFRVWVTQAQKTALKKCLIENGIKYGKVR